MWAIIESVMVEIGITISAINVGWPDIWACPGCGSSSSWNSDELNCYDCGYGGLRWEPYSEQLIESLKGLRYDLQIEISAGYSSMSPLDVKEMIKSRLGEKGGVEQVLFTRRA
jgi:hypothetical protein